MKTGGHLTPAKLRRVMGIEGIYYLSELSRRTGIHPSALSLFMGGQRGISKQSLQKLAKAFPKHRHSFVIEGF
jgi:transcriptional regulator with XRE-family HTH domain